MEQGKANVNDMPARVLQITAPDGENKDDMLRMLEVLRQQVEQEIVTRIGVVAGRSDGSWQSEFSRTGDRRIDAAMLIELAIRRLGFDKTDG